LFSVGRFRAKIDALLVIGASVTSAHDQPSPNLRTWIISRFPRPMTHSVKSFTKSCSVEPFKNVVAKKIFQAQEAG